MKIHIPTPLRQYTGGQQTVTVGGANADVRYAGAAPGFIAGAMQVNIQLPHYQGKVTSVNGSTIVIDSRGTSQTIEVTADTRYQNGQNSA